MQRKEYRIRVTRDFKNEFEASLIYISLELKNPYAAERLKDSTLKEIQKRLPGCEDFQIYGKDPIRGYDFYRIRVGNYFVYYVVVDDVMELRHFIYKKSDIKKIVLN